jgi:hypothetical protein
MSFQSSYGSVRRLTRHFKMALANELLFWLAFAQMELLWIPRLLFMVRDYYNVAGYKM